MEPIEFVTGPIVPVPGDDVDTDRIIPARFMRCVTFDGLGKYAFFDARFNGDGSEKDHPFNDPRYSSATVMLVGSNFGCGSSREHAPQSLAKYGIRAIIGKSFAEIFFGNCTTLGIPCVTVTDEDHAAITSAVVAEPSQAAVIDVAGATVTLGALTVPAALPPSAREALLGGIWDPIALLAAKPEAVRERAAALGYVQG